MKEHMTSLLRFAYKGLGKNRMLDTTILKRRRTGGQK